MNDIKPSIHVSVFKEEGKPCSCMTNNPRDRVAHGYATLWCRSYHLLMLMVHDESTSQVILKTQI